MRSVSWRVPSSEQRRAARAAFSVMVRFFEAAIGVRPPSDAEPQVAFPVSPAAQEPSSEAARASPMQAEFLDVTQAWREIVQNNAPQEVRNNAWLMVSWAVWCFRYEEPRLYWAAAIACLLVGSAWVYDAARAVAERVAA
jgi:hypothetical protein